MRSLDTDNSVAIVGCEGLDIYNAYSLARNKAIGEVLLIGTGCKELAAETAGLLLSVSADAGKRVRAGDLRDAAAADIVVLTGGRNPKPDEPKIELAQVLDIIRDEVRVLIAAGFEGIFLVTAEPVDVFAFFVHRESGFPTSRVIGISTGNDPHQILDPPGTNVWCSGQHDGAAFLDNCDPVCPYFNEAAERMSKITANDFEFSGNRVVGLATCVTRICEAILRDEREIFPVSYFAKGEYNVSDVYISLPCVLGREGVVRTVKLPVTSAEQRRIEKYADELRNVIESLTYPSHGIAAVGGQ